MATISAKILKHHLKLDGTYNVKIRVFHKNEKRYIDTEHFVTPKQLSKKLTIKDPIISRLVNKQIDEYRIAVSDLGDRLQMFNAENLRDYLYNKEEDINFIKFCDDQIKQLKENGRSGTASNYKTVRNSLVDFFRRDKVSILEITVNMLRSYEKFLRGKRSITRINQLNKTVTIHNNGLTHSGLYNYMRDLRSMFNLARDKYNDEDLGIIGVPHYPFVKYKVGSPPETRKRSLRLSTLKIILNCQVSPGGRAELARDLFMLSFYMCGINAVDLYYCSEENVKKGRLEYNRSKTKGRRKDNAFISIKVIDEAKPLLKKYLGKLKFRYVNYKGLDSALSKGLEQIFKITKTQHITFYCARHTFANSARNDCRISKDDLALALNHIDHGQRTTDIYLSKDWKIVDEVQLSVVNCLRRFSTLEDL